MKDIKVLIVEDETIVAIDIQNSLEQFGYRVTGIVDNGKSAIEAADETHPDIVIMDIMLKGDVSGIEAAAAIREQFEIPVIFLTAYADEATIDKAKIAQPYGYLIKPFKPKELLSIIEMAVYKHDKDTRVRKERDIYHTLAQGKETKDSIFVRADYRLNRIRFLDIYFIEALKDYIIINTSDKSYTTHATMKEIMGFLPVKDFVRVHRSYIVNLNKIFSIKYPDLVIEGKMKVIPIGGIFRKELFSRLNLI